MMIFTSELFSQTGIWVSQDNLPSERGFSASAVLDNKIYIIGGFPDSDEPALNDPTPPANFYQNTICANHFLDIHCEACYLRLHASVANHDVHGETCPPCKHASIS